MRSGIIISCLVATSALALGCSGAAGERAMPAPQVGPGTSQHAQPKASTARNENPLDRAREANAERDSAPGVTPDALRQRIESGGDVELVELRNVDGPAAIPGAQVTREDEIAAWAGRYPKTAYIVVYCQCPAAEASTRAVRALRAAGFGSAFVLTGHTEDWAAAHLHGPGA